MYLFIMVIKPLKSHLVLENGFKSTPKIFLFNRKVFKCSLKEYWNFALPSPSIVHMMCMRMEEKYGGMVFKYYLLLILNVVNQGDC